jgi:hypothetical protein
VDFRRPATIDASIGNINNHGQIVGYYDNDGFFASPVILPPFGLLLDESSRLSY